MIDYCELISNLTGININSLRKYNSGGIKRLFRDYDPSDCTEDQYHKLCMMRQLIACCMLEQPPISVVLNTSIALLNYCKGLYSGFEDQEMVYLILLHGSGELMGSELVAAGSRTVSILPIDLILRRALLRGACNVAVCHNHLGADCTISSTDIETTKRLKDACTSVGINLFDHVIVSVGDALSMYEEGVFDN